MLRLFFVLNILCVFTSTHPLSATNDEGIVTEETTGYSPQFIHIASHQQIKTPDNSLLLLDLDGTTVRSKIYVSRTHATPQIRAQNKNFLTLVKGKYGQTVSDRIKRARIPTPILTEDEFPQMLCEMASRGVHILPFTNRTENSVDHTLREFKQLELTFGNWNKRNPTFEDLEFGHHIYIDGILYANSQWYQNKGLSLEVIGRRLNEFGTFTSVGMVDDKHDNGTDILVAIPHFPVPFTFYHYQSKRYELYSPEDLLEFYKEAVVKGVTDTDLMVSVQSLVPDFDALLKQTETPLPQLFTPQG